MSCYDAIIIGGGLTGLATAYYLSGQGKKICLIEKKSELGGLLECYHLGDYSIEKYYHHILPGDVELLRLMEALGLGGDVQWRPSLVGYWMNEKAYPLNTPIDIMRFPFLSMGDKWKLSQLVNKCRGSKSFSTLDSISARDWVIENAGESVYQNFFFPLLRGKFGDNEAVISAAWLQERVRIRSNRSVFRGEKLAYPTGSFSILLEALQSVLKSRKVDIILNTSVTEILSTEYSFKGVNTETDTIEAPIGIYTGNPQGLATIGNELLNDTFLSDLQRIPYQHTLCLLLGFDKPITSSYWLNIGDKSLPFSLLVEHTNFVKKGYGDDHLVYLASYYQNQDNADFIEDDSVIFHKWYKVLESIYSLSHDSLRWWKLSKSSHTSPIYRIGYLENLKSDFSTPMNGLYQMGMSKSYPERSLNDAVKQARKMSDCL